MTQHTHEHYPHESGCLACQAAKLCNYCGAPWDLDGHHCTNGRCAICHRNVCGPGGATSPGHEQFRPGVLKPGEWTPADNAKLSAGIKRKNAAFDAWLKANPLNVNAHERLLLERGFTAGWLARAVQPPK
jgi:hypothetical protein